MKIAPTTYSLVSRILHWTNALLILILILSGEAAEDGAGLGYQAHVVLGTACLILIIFQIGWYLFGPKPAELPGLSRLRKLAFHWNHHLILLAALFATGSGFMVWMRFGSLGDIHEESATPIIILSLMHIAGVLYYQISKGNTLGRMAPLLFGRFGKL